MSGRRTELARLVIASGNAGKLREIAAILAPLGTAIVPQGELGVPEAAEPHGTFVENALAKARHAARITGLPALADDSGLFVDALAGGPGVRSARYAEDGDPALPQDERNNRKLLAALTHETNRRAHYYCVMVLVRSADDPQPLIAEGEWHGEVTREPRGAGGFGYDPLFHIPAAGCTVAEMTPEAKNRVSHRAQALLRLAQRLGGGAGAP